MKKGLCFILAAALIGMLCAPALAGSAGAPAQYLFGYIDDVNDTGFELVTNDQDTYQFMTQPDTQISPSRDLAVGDAVRVAYLGGLEMNSVQQAVQVPRVTVLQCVNAVITAVAADAVTVQLEGDGRSYTFSLNSADVADGEDGIVVNSQAEICYDGALQDGLPAGQAQQLNYVHITVFGVSDSTSE